MLYFIRDTSRTASLSWSVGGHLLLLGGQLVLGRAPCPVRHLLSLLGLVLAVVALVVGAVALVVGGGRGVAAGRRRGRV